MNSSVNYLFQRKQILHKTTSLLCNGLANGVENRGGWKILRGLRKKDSGWVEHRVCVGKDRKVCCKGKWGKGGRKVPTFVTDPSFIFGGLLNSARETQVHLLVIFFLSHHS